MPTSSIFEHVTIKGEKETKAFIDALEKSSNDLEKAKNDPSSSYNKIHERNLKKHQEEIQEARRLMLKGLNEK